MAAPARTCTCGHPEDVHNARRPDGACTACTQCDGLLRDIPHDWHRCRCDAFKAPAPIDRTEEDPT